jgi:uncharacterized NAD(P)/FAD-binding protein YdhS
VHRPLRVAIVGLGPKGMFALERLTYHADRMRRARSIEVDLFEPHPVPGAGPIYDTGQPEYLRMNFPAAQINAWDTAGAVVPASERCSFLDWHACRHGGSEVESYPSRALVGRYLSDCCGLLMSNAPRTVTLRLRAERVEGLRISEAEWELTSAGGVGRYDEVLIATGHEQDWAGGLRAGWRHAAKLVPAVFPVQRWLSRDHVVPGSVVGVRGFALTFIDVALALTEGRGGAFEACIDHPYRLRYLGAEGEIARILPFTRTGRPMLAKPTSAATVDLPALEDLAQVGREQILALGPTFDLHADLLPTIASTAGAALLAAQGARAGARALSRTSQMLQNSLRESCRGVVPQVEVGAAEELDRSLAIGAGLRAPDRDWALGHAWRTLYPALVTRLSADGLTPEAWPSFRRLAAQMERLAFGPSPQNAAKLLALIDAGRVRLNHVQGGRLETRNQITQLCSVGAESRLDCVVDAVLPGPGARGSKNALIDHLIADGHARISAGRRGLEVREDGSSVGRDGDVAPGLALSGRLTEDSVIGNDTLSRTLHPLSDLWAQRIIRRAEAPRSSAADERLVGSSG